MTPLDSIKTIRENLDQLEAGLNRAADSEVRNWDALELPDLVTSIITDLQPLLTTYEAALYWHLFEKSYLRTGAPFARVSVRQMQNGIAVSMSGQSTAWSYGSVKNTIDGLLSKGIIQLVGDTNQGGTPYRVCIPDEIELCKKQREARALEPASPQINPSKELDFYNVAENRLKVFERDNYCCHYCQRQLTRFSATLDHLQPVSRGGDNSFDNLVTACLRCNSRRGNKPVMEAIIYQDMVESRRDDQTSELNSGVSEPPD